MKNGKYLTYPKIDREQTWNFPSVLSIFDFNCKIINQNVVINGNDVIDTSDKVWIVQNGKYLTYPKIDREQTWNFSLILSIFDFECKILDQNATINGRDIINTIDQGLECKEWQISHISQNWSRANLEFPFSFVDI